jgi:alkylation response protein AidB-like acyl-CoA dehydrogenase
MAQRILLRARTLAPADHEVVFELATLDNNIGHVLESRARFAEATVQYQAMLDLTCIAVGAEMLGGAQRTLEMAVEYAKIREQYGRKIGSFQAIKHKCASMLVEVEACRSAVYYALWAAQTSADDLAATASLTKAFCSDTYVFTAGENIQIHGASASPGNTPPTCTSSERRTAPCSSAAPTITASNSPSGSASELVLPDLSGGGACWGES